MWVAIDGFSNYVCACVAYTRTHIYLKASHIIAESIKCDPFKFGYSILAGVYCVRGCTYTHIHTHTQTIFIYTPARLYVAKLGRVAPDALYVVCY